MSALAHAADDWFVWLAYQFVPQLFVTCVVGLIGIGALYIGCKGLDAAQRWMR